MSESELQRFKREIDRFDHAMLVTRRGESELRSRPMRIAGSDERGHLWFISSVDSGKLEELTDDPCVNVALQQGQRFMSISGLVRVTRDQDAIDKYWSASQNVWFEKGRADPELVLLEVIPTYAEYWDRTGVEGLKLVLFEARALVTGETLDTDDSQHEKIEFSET